MTCDHTESEDRESNLISGSATPSPAGSERAEQQNLAFGRIVGPLSDLIANFTVEQKERLTEALTQREEAAAREQSAAADEREAAATIKWAQAIREQAKADAVGRADLAKRAIEGRDLAETIYAAVEKLSEAISRIRQQGGAVFFDGGQLLDLIRAAREQFPDDQIIVEAESKLLELSHHGDDLG